jgi:hypothetical protein
MVIWDQDDQSVRGFMMQKALEGGSRRMTRVKYYLGSQIPSLYI